MVSQASGHTWCSLDAIFFQRHVRAHEVVVGMEYVHVVLQASFTLCCAKRFSLQLCAALPLRQVESLNKCRVDMIAKATRTDELLDDSNRKSLNVPYFC